MIKNLTKDDQQLIFDMRGQMALRSKRRNLVNDFRRRQRRFTQLITIIITIIISSIIFLLTRPFFDQELAKWGGGDIAWETGILYFLLLFIVIWVTTRFSLINIPPFTTILSIYQKKTRLDNIGVLDSYRRWSQIYYDGKNISESVPYILGQVDSKKSTYTNLKQLIAKLPSQKDLKESLAKLAIPNYIKFLKENSIIYVANGASNNKTQIRTMRYVIGDRINQIILTTNPYSPKNENFKKFPKSLSILIRSQVDGNYWQMIDSNDMSIKQIGKQMKKYRANFGSAVDGYFDDFNNEIAHDEVQYLVTFNKAVLRWENDTVIDFSKFTDKELKTSKYKNLELQS